MSTSIGGNNSGPGVIMLFGVRVVVDSIRKSVSLNNLSQYVHSSNDNIEKDKETAAGYASTDEAVHHSSSSAAAAATGRERKRGIPWTEDEHKLFLLGLQKVGKGDWRGISRNFVKTRTPTQVASHAQKYFLRRSNFNRRRRRSSLFDITTDSVTAPIPTIKQQSNHENAAIQSQSQSKQTNSEISNPRFSAIVIAAEKGGFPSVPLYPSTIGGGLKALEQADNNGGCSENNKLVRPVPVKTMADLDLNQRREAIDDASPLSLKLSLSMSSAFQVIQNINNGNGDSMISVA